MLVGVPLMETEQNRSILIEDLPEVIMDGAVAVWPSSDWYHLKLWGTSATPMIVHKRVMAFSAPCMRVCAYRRDGALVGPALRRL
jgi:hypothetical protein